MAVTQDVPLTAAARRAATAATIAANKAKAAAGTGGVIKPHTASAKTTTSMRTPASAPPVNTPGAAPKPSLVAPRTAGTGAGPKSPLNKTTAAAAGSRSTTPLSMTTKASTTALKPSAKPSTAAPTSRATARTATASNTVASTAASRSAVPASGPRSSAAPRTPLAAPRTPSGPSNTPPSPPKHPSSSAPKSTLAARTSAVTKAATSSTATAKKSVSPSVSTSNTTAIAARQVPSTASARTTTSIRIPPSSSGPAAKPPAVAGRPPVNMTPTTIRTPAQTPSTSTSIKRGPNASATTPKPVTRLGSMTSDRSRTSTASTATASTATAAKKTSVSSARGGLSPAGSTRSTTTTATKPITPVELKKAIENAKLKLEEVSAHLQVKESEVASLRQQLETWSYIDNYAATETASSDGGETLVPEIDLSKLAAQDKDIVLTTIGAKEKELARKKHQVRTLKARVERLRMEHERRVKELAETETEVKAAHDATLMTLQQQLADATLKQNDVVLLRQKLDETRALHATTIEELNRIHDDKLQSLEMELQEFKHERPVSTSSGSGHTTQERYHQDLEGIKNTRRKELSQLLKEHQEEIDNIKTDFDRQKKEAAHEYETELRERFNSELEQIKASHASLLSSRVGQESSTAEVLQERQGRALDDFRAKTLREHEQYIVAHQNKHQTEISKLENKHKDQLAGLQGKIRKLQEKYDTDMASIRSNADAQAEERKKRHADEVARRNEKHAAELLSCEASTKKKSQQELDAVQEKFSSFVADIQGSQDMAMKELETSYETRIAELIVEHENRVRELENEANEQVQQELERVEMEFEIDRERLAEEQHKKLAELKAVHENAVEQLEDQLTKAEDRAKEAIAGIKLAKRTHEDEMREVKADMEAQLSAVRLSIEALVAAQERDGKNGAEALQAGHATIIRTEKSAHEMHMSEVLSMKENAWMSKNSRLLKSVQELRDKFNTIESERNRARAAMDTTETRLKEEYAAAIESLHKDHYSRVEHSQEAARARMARVNKTQEEHAETHENKLADLLTTHHHTMQGLKDEQKALLKTRKQDNQERLVTLQRSLDALEAKSGRSASPSTATTTAMLQSVQQAAKQLAELKKNNEMLKGENAQLEGMMKQLQDSMPTLV
ncbi:hypothetical protein EDD11_001328 [Mortierella claussenii]|nr:hypothetical protein EDD11_001328 [Mortierella claussenii]